MSPLYARKTEEVPNQIPQDLLEEVRQGLQGLPPKKPAQNTDNTEQVIHDKEKKAVIGYSLAEEIYALMDYHKSRKGASSIKGGGQQ